MLQQKLLPRVNYLNHCSSQLGGVLLVMLVICSSIIVLPLKVNLRVVCDLKFHLELPKNSS